jgi:hypothetical protein
MALFRNTARLRVETPIHPEPPDVGPVTFRINREGKKPSVEGRKKKDEKAVIKIVDPTFSSLEKSKAIRNAINLDGGDEDEDEEISRFGMDALNGVRHLSRHDPLRYPHQDAFQMDRGDLEREAEKERHRQTKERDKITEMHVPMTPGGSGGMKKRKRKKEDETKKPRLNYAEDELDTDSEEDAIEVARKVVESSGTTLESVMEEEEPRFSSRVPGIIASTFSTSSSSGKEKGGRGRKRDGIDLKETPYDSVVFTEDLYKTMRAGENEVLFSLDRDAPDLMKEQVGKTMRELNTTIVNPLATLDSAIRMSVRTGEEIAVLSESKEWDSVLSGLRFGKTQGHPPREFVDVLEMNEEGREDEEEGEGKGKEPEEKRRRRNPSLNILETAERMKEKRRSRETNGEDSSIQERMNELTKRLIRGEKESKRIVSDASLVGLGIQMKETVLNAIMFDWTECVQMRDGEKIVPHFEDGGSGLCKTVGTKEIVWSQRDMFSLCSQLVSLQEQRYIYRSSIEGLSIKEILEQNPYLGEPCSRVYDEKFFRPPVGSERPCRFGNQCVMFLLGQMSVFPDTLNRVVNEIGFPAREFYRPEELRAYKNRKWPKKRRSCLMCYEMAMQYAFYYYRRDNRDAPFVIQNHWNKIEGENSYPPASMYPLEDNERRWTGFILPKVKRTLTSLRPSTTLVRVGETVRRLPCFVEASQDFC